MTDTVGDEAKDSDGDEDGGADADEDAETALVAAVGVSAFSSGGTNSQAETADLAN